MTRKPRKVYVLDENTDFPVEHIPELERRTNARIVRMADVGLHHGMSDEVIERRIARHPRINGIITQDRDFINGVAPGVLNSGKDVIYVRRNPSTSSHSDWVYIKYSKNRQGDVSHREIYRKRR